MNNIFTAAVEKAQPKTSAKDKKKLIVPVQTEGKIKKLNETRDELKNLEADEALLLDDIRPIAEAEFLKQVKLQGMRPDSFVLQDTDGAKLLLIVQDKYAKLTEGTEAQLRETFKKQADDLIETETVFALNPAILNSKEYGAKIQKALSDCITKLQIPDEVKGALIQPNITKSIKKGTIEKLNLFKDFTTLFKLIKPVFQFKNQK